MNRLTRGLALFGLMGALVTSAEAQPLFQRSYEVTVTNITNGQVFTQFVLASHRSGVKLFTLGEPASEALEALAEGGETDPLALALEATPGVLDVAVADGPLPPGESVTLVVETRGRFDHVSLAAMLVPTNDAFTALNDVAGPRGRRVGLFRLPAYDAGTELNDELCDHIPGPPGVCGGEGTNLLEDGEGYVHIHRGIHGGGDLDEAMRDWRNPVAAVRIRRVR
jgi:hypothetical protein